MNGAKLEVTVRIKCDELLQLLNTMTPMEQQRITTRSRISDIEAELARVRATAVPEAEPPKCEIPRLFNDVDCNPLLDATLSIPPQTPILGDEPTRFPHATLPPPFALAGTLLAGPLAVVQPLREVVSFPTLSPQVFARLSAEEITMLPMEIRLNLPEVRNWMTAPRIEMTPAPDGRVIGIHSAPCKDHGHSIRVTEQTPAAARSRLLTIFSSFAAVFLVGLCAVYLLA
jgi:hypothetical protein